MERWLSELPVHVARVRFSTDDLEGASVWESGATPVILLNERAGRVTYSLSRRAILAHELCHLLHDGGDADIATRVSSSEGRGNYEEAVEQRARGFAPAFLAPRDQLRSWAGEARLPRDPRGFVAEVARHWGLSYEGAIWHAKNTGLIEPNVAAALSAERVLPDLPTDDFEGEEIGFPPSMLNPDLPDESSQLMDGWATRAVVEALESSAISLGRAKELLAWR
jgi:Zn-dependent peptidase ImmA (M78 family)